MNWTLHEDGIVRKTGQSACFMASEAEKEFWMRIQELEAALTEISTMPEYDQDDAHRLRELAKRALDKK